MKAPESRGYRAVSAANSDFGRRLLDARVAARMSQTELATASNVAPGQISRYEAGGNLPRPHVMANLAAGLGVDVDWLANGVGSMVKVSQSVTNVEPFAINLKEQVRELLRRATATGLYGATDEATAEMLLVRGLETIIPILAMSANAPPIPKG